MTPEEKRSALARDLAVNLDAVEEYLREKEERARLKATGMFELLKVVTKLMMLFRTRHCSTTIPDRCSNWSLWQVPAIHNCLISGS